MLPKVRTPAELAEQPTTATRPPADAELVQIVDAALADAGRRSGPHLFCHPGCTPCCHGVFAISSLDAARLNEGLTILTRTEPTRAAIIYNRIRTTRQRLTPAFPGDPTTGHLATDEASQDRFEDFANDEPCPILDLATGTCDLYAHRPITCRVFGPPVHSEDGLGICELCFQHATAEDIAAGEMHLPSPALEAALTAPLGAWTTIIPFAFPREPAPRDSASHQGKTRTA